jgi:hypothetical protein
MIGRVGNPPLPLRTVNALAHPDNGGVDLHVFAGHGKLFKQLRARAMPRPSDRRDRS